MKLQPVILLTAFLALLFLSPNASACSCIEATPCENFGHSAAVFIGRLVGTQTSSERTQNGNTVQYVTGKSAFAVEEAFKGVNTTMVAIDIFSMKGTSCEWAGLIMGERYLVYAGSFNSTRLVVGPCSPTRPLEHAKADLDFLRSLPRLGTGGRFFGTVAVETGSRKPDPLPDVIVILEDEARNQTKVKTDREGNYELIGLKPGKYTARPVLPANYIPRDKYSKDREVMIADRGCTSANFWLVVDGSVSGSVTDNRGRPAPADLRLVSLSDEKTSFYGETDEEGRYQIDGVPPGTYLLYLTLFAREEKKPYYHPGVVEKSEATTIKLSQGQKVADYNFSLPSELEVIGVSGTVNYADGRPAVGAEVRLIVSRSNPAGNKQARNYHAHELYVDTRTNESGVFLVHGYKGVSYEILAVEDFMRAVEEKRMLGSSASSKDLVFTQDTDGIELVIPLKPNPYYTRRALSIPMPLILRP